MKYKKIQKIYYQKKYNSEKMLERPKNAQELIEDVQKSKINF